MRRLLCLLFILACQATLARAEGSGAAFLKIGVGARPIAMGNAFTAVADDINAISWNPAGLARIGSREVGATHAELFADTRYEYVAYAHPLSNRSGGSSYGTLGLGILHLSQGTIQGRDASRRPTAGFSGSDTALSLAFGRAIGGSASLGSGLKYLSSSIGGESAHSVALDLGATYRPRVRGLALGASLQNLGPGLAFISDTNSLPLTLSVGASLRLGSGILPAMDLRTRPGDGKISAGLGMEYAALPVLSLRAGYLSALAGGLSANGAANDKFGDAAGLGAGIGLRVSRYYLDYAFTPFGELGNVQRISLGTRF